MQIICSPLEIECFECCTHCDWSLPMIYMSTDTSEGLEKKFSGSCLQISKENGETEALRVGDLGPVQTDATLLDVTSMLRPFAHPDLRCCGLLGVVAQVTRLHVALEMLTWKKSSQKVSSLREAQ